MFTGIIQSIGKLKKEKNILEIEILDNLFDMAIGDSIAVDGICLTVKEILQNKFTVDVSEETLKKTTYLVLDMNSSYKNLCLLDSRHFITCSNFLGICNSTSDFSLRNRNGRNTWNVKVLLNI